MPTTKLCEACGITRFRLHEEEQLEDRHKFCLPCFSAMQMLDMQRETLAMHFIVQGYKQPKEKMERLMKYWFNKNYA